MQLIEIRWSLIVGPSKSQRYLIVQIEMKYNFSTWREHLETFTMRTPPLFEKEKKKSGDEEGEGRAGEEESEEEEEGDEEEREARREKMAADNQDHFMR